MTTVSVGFMPEEGKWEGVVENVKVEVVNSNWVELLRLKAITTFRVGWHVANLQPGEPPWEAEISTAFSFSTQ